MKSINLWGRAVAVAAILLLVGVPGFAQLQTGNLYGTIVDDQGAALPGVTVTLTGQGAPAVQVTDAQGRFRFLSLSPASYRLDAQLEGFSSVEYPSIQINVGRNTEIEVTMNAAVEDVITVTAESPLLDERRISTGATVSQTELEKIPTARDPWAILQTTPGVLTDRVNVGGNESGQQSTYTGPGSGGDQSVWAVDGVVITDMAALGSSPAYFDFDSFEEMQVTTGGSDTTLATPGVTLNIVTKRGTNEWRGSARYFIADQDWQSDLSVSGIELGPNQAAFNQGNRIVTVEDYGAELGGPIVRDRLWIWGSYGTQEVDLLTIANVSDFTELETMNIKLNAQIAPSNSATGFALNSDKVKIGRNAGPTRPQETTWNQSKFGPDPTAYKIEDTHIFSSAFYLTGMYSVVNGGFQLVPQGGATFNDENTQLDENFIWRQNFLLYQTERPQEQIKADASSFFNTGNLSHELKFGAGYREAEVTTLTRWPGFGLELNFYVANYGYPFNPIGLTRDAFPAILQEYTSAYLQDTMTFGNLTFNAGLRYDIQGGENLARTSAANPEFPEILPSVTFGGGDIGFEWKTLAPRLGLTYALGESRQTLLRASYSRFADQLGTGTGLAINPLFYASYVYFQYDDINGNGTADPNEVLLDLGRFGPNPNSGNYDIRNGGLLVSNGVDPGLDAPLTDELLFGIEHALRPEFVVGVNLTYRQLTDLVDLERLVFDGDASGLENLDSIGRKHRRDDYQPRTITSTLPNGEVRQTVIYELRPGVTSRNGVFYENGDREQEFLGASLTFNKRLSNRWMVRGNVSWQDWTWNVPDSELEDPTLFLGGGHDGDPVLQGSGVGSGAKGGIYINSNWSYSMNGLYQVAPDRPWGFNLAANVTGREGYPIPYYRRVGRAGFPGQVSVQVTESDEIRNEDIHVLDARVEKEFTFSDFGLTLGVDIFNALNENFVLQRRHQLALGASNNVTEILSPRIFRIGARLSFR
ncbi:MAG TPA: TonB-dependent receptor [Thermoanaerobaculia bacterium]|nr:TonB-dependent receptor [Thermoanaerobaculia bacterium]